MITIATIAHTHHTKVLAIYDTLQAHRDLVVRFGSDLGSICHSYLALQLWQLDYPDQALQHSQTARTLAQEMSHPHSLVFALALAVFLYQFRREAPAVQEQAEVTITVSIEQGFPERLACGARSCAAGPWLCRDKMKQAHKFQSDPNGIKLRIKLSLPMAYGIIKICHSRPIAWAHPPTWADCGLNRCFASGRHAFPRMNEPAVDQHKHLFTDTLCLNLMPFQSDPNFVTPILH